MYFISLEPLSFECELHPLTGTLLEARIKLQRRLLTLLLPAEPSSTSWQSLPPVKALKCVLVKIDVFAVKICKRAFASGSVTLLAFKMMDDCCMRCNPAKVARDLS